MEKNNLEQSYAMRFCVKPGKCVTDTYGKIQKAFDNDSLSRAQVFRWHKDFVNGRETVEDESRSGRLASLRISTNVDRVRALIGQNRRLTNRMIADELNINECTVHQIVTQDLNTRKLCAKMVPKDLNDNEKVRRNKCPQKCFSGSKLKQILLIRSYQATIVGFSNTTLKPRGRVRNGTRHCLQEEESSHEQIKNQGNGHIFVLAG
jgi:hypothetical protein